MARNRSFLLSHLLESNALEEPKQAPINAGTWSPPLSNILSHIKEVSEQPAKLTHKKWNYSHFLPFFSGKYQRIRAPYCSRNKTPFEKGSILARISLQKVQKFLFFQPFCQFHARLPESLARTLIWSDRNRLKRFWKFAGSSAGKRKD